eukprot:Hpha_TRINITY_DN16332_c0_g2::TRINITY_DN16332_c0_g2_i1::g.60859::m.60859
MAGEFVKRSPYAKPADEHLAAASWRNSAGTQQRSTPRSAPGAPLRGQPTETRNRGEGGHPGLALHATATETVTAEWLIKDCIAGAESCGLPPDHYFAIPAHVHPNALNALSPGSRAPGERRVTAVLLFAGWQQADMVLASLKVRLQALQGLVAGRADIPREQRNSTLVLKNLPFALRHDNLITSLRLLGVRPAYTRYYHDERGMFKGIAFIKFLCRAAAERAKFQIEQMEVAGRRVRVEFKNKSPAAGGFSAAGPASRGPSHSRGSPYAPPMSSPSQPSPTSPSLSPAQPPLGGGLASRVHEGGGSPSLPPTAPHHHQQQPQLAQRQQQEAAEFRQEWDQRFRALVADTDPDAHITLFRKGLTFNREQLLKELCQNYGLRWERGEKSVIITPGSGGGSGSVKNSPAAPPADSSSPPPPPPPLPRETQSSRSRQNSEARSTRSEGRAPASANSSPALAPTDRSAYKNLNSGGSGMSVMHARGPFDQHPFPTGRGRPLSSSPEHKGSDSLPRA